MPTSSSSSKPGSTMIVGFGNNYYSQMGPALPRILSHATINHHPSTTNEELDGETKTIEIEPLPSTGKSCNVVSYQFSPYSTSPSYATPWEEEGDEVVSISCTVTGTFFLTKSGKLWTCGTLHGTIRPSITRMTIALPLKCVQIATGRHFCLARMEGGLAVVAWGAGHFGQLGLGSECAPFVDQPTVIESLLPHVVGSPVTSVAAGYWHSMAATQAGQVYCWGANRNSQCGVKPSKEPPTITIPQRVQFDHLTNSSSTEIRIEKICAGRSHSVVLDQNGQVYAFGSNQWAQCGALTRRKGGVAPAKHVEALTRVRIVEIAAGDAHTLALTGGGRIFSFGAGGEGQLGTGLVISLNPKPKLVGDLDFVAIEAGREWKTKQQQQVEVGSNDASKNEMGSSPDQNASSARPSLQGSEMLANIPKIVQITAKGNSSFAVSNFGHVYSWGCNDCGNCGIPKPDPSTMNYVDPGISPAKLSTMRQYQTHSFDSTHNLVLPQRLDSLRDMNVTSIAAAPTFTWCLGTRRQTPEDPDVGRTLYEIQEAKRLNALERSRIRGTKQELDGENEDSTTPISPTSTTKAPGTASISPTVEGEHHIPVSSHPMPLDPPEMKNGSHVDGAVSMTLGGGTNSNVSGANREGRNGGDSHTSAGSTSSSQTQSQQSEGQNGNTADVSTPVSPPGSSRLPASPVPILPAAPSAAADVVSPTGSNPSTTPGRKKRLFSPKKLVKAIVRRASGNAQSNNKSASDSIPHAQLED